MLLDTNLVHYLDNGIEISSPHDSSDTCYSQEVESNLSKVMFDKWKIFLSTSLCCKHLLLKKVFTGVEKPLNAKFSEKQQSKLAHSERPSPIKTDSQENNNLTSKNDLSILILTDFCHIYHCYKYLNYFTQNLSTSSNKNLLIARWKKESRRQSFYRLAPYPISSICRFFENYLNYDKSTLSCWKERVYVSL